MTSADSSRTSVAMNIYPLPAPKISSRFSVERALLVRRSIREYARDALSLADLAQLLWSAQGITSSEGFRTTPSAGACYPLEAYAVCKNVTGLAAGVYHYVPGLKEHHLEVTARGSFAAKLFALSTQQDFIKQVPLNIILATVTARMEKQYGDMALRYVLMEMGHAAQNIHLQAEALGLSSVAVGFLQEEKVKELLQLTGDPLYMVSVGHRKAQKAKNEKTKK
jgi:SagB-type dehydrogenase family enzyme